MWLDVNSTEKEKKVPVFISLTGAGTYQALKNIWSPDLPKEKKVGNLMLVFK